MYINVCFLLLIVSCFSTSRALPASCQTDWKINWNQHFPDFSSFQSFSNPGEVLPGVTVNDTLQFVGILWNAPSWQEIMGLVCVHFGPVLNTLYPDKQIQSECDLLVTSLQKGQEFNIFGQCVSFWDQIGLENVARSLLSYYDPCFQHGTMQNVSSFSSSRCHLDLLATVYASGFLEKASRITFNLLDWLGPSPLSGDWNGACSALRILLSDYIDQIVDRMKNLLMYPAADTLEYFHQVDICNNNIETVQDLWAVFQQVDGDVCEFLSRNPSPQEYLEKGAKLIDTVQSIPFDAEVCADTLTRLVSSYDQDGDKSYQITGRNLNSDPNRQRFCGEIASALSDNSPYTPTSYLFPFDEVSVTSNPKYSSLSFLWQENDLFGKVLQYINPEPGEVLPDFAFFEAVNVIGAFLRSDTLSDGMVVLCDVFESFLSELEPSFGSMCTALRNGDTAEVEKMCSQTLCPRYSHPSLRKPTSMYMLVTGVDMTRKLLELPVISRDHVCSALHEYFHSKNNLQSLVRFSLNVYLAELLPLADKICKDYDSVLKFLEKKLYMSGAKFQTIIRSFSDLILTNVGFSDRNQFCQTIGRYIDTSGRVSGALAEIMQREVLLVLSDSRRCEESAQTLHRAFAVLNFEEVFAEYLTQYTGYMSLTSACGNLNAFFDPGLCQAPSTGSIPEISFLVMTLTVWVTHLICAL